MPPSLSLQNIGGVLSPNQIALTPTQRALYDRLRAQGMPDAIARQLAVAVAKSARSRALALAKSAKQAAVVALAKTSYHEAFVQQAKKQLHPAFFDQLHVAARAVAGGVASGKARRAPIATEDSPELGEVVKADGAKPPKGVQAACKRGLELMGEYGGDGLTDGAKARARAMAAGQPVSAANLAKMHGWFARHDSYAKEASPPSPGYVAWLLWGGDAGKVWADSQAERLEKASGQKPLGAAYSHARAKTKDKKKQKRLANAYLRRQGHQPIGKAEFNEGDHPRDEAGRFSEGGGAVVPGRTSESVGLKSSYSRGIGQLPAASAHDHLATGRTHLEQAEQAANAGKFNEAAEHYSAAAEHAQAANQIARANSNAVTGKATRASKEAKAEEKERQSAAKVHEAAFKNAERAGDKAKGHLHFLAALAHAQIGGAVKRVSQARVPEMSLVKAAAALRLAKSFRLAKADEFDEAKHPRADNGQFGDSGATSASDKHFAKADSSRGLAKDALRAGNFKLAEEHRSQAQEHHKAGMEAMHKEAEARRSALGIKKGLGPLPQEFGPPEAQPKRRKRAKDDEDEVKGKKRKVPVSLETTIVKAEETPWQRLVYSTVYAPDELDTDGDFMDAETIEKAAHNAMEQGIYINHEHAGDPVGAHVVESYIAPCDMDLGSGGEPCPVKKGSWLMALKVTDPVIWAGVLDGSYGGFSLEGSAVAELAEAGG